MFLNLFESDLWASVKGAKTLDDVSKLLRNVESYYGRHSSVYLINDYEVIKVSENDPSFVSFAKKCYESRRNSLFPVVSDFCHLDCGAFCCLMERVTPLIKFKDAYNVEELVELLLTGSELSEGYTELMRSLHFSPEDLDMFAKEVASLGREDINVNNMGRRRDGSLVIYDPVCS